MNNLWLWLFLLADDVDVKLFKCSYSSSRDSFVPVREDSTIYYLAEFKDESLVSKFYNLYSQVYDYSKDGKRYAYFNAQYLATAKDVLQKTMGLTISEGAL